MIILAYSLVPVFVCNEKKDVVLFKRACLYFGFLVLLSHYSGEITLAAENQEDFQKREETKLLFKKLTRSRSIEYCKDLENYYSTLNSCRSYKNTYKLLAVFVYIPLQVIEYTMRAFTEFDNICYFGPREYFSEIMGVFSSYVSYSYRFWCCEKRRN